MINKIKLLQHHQGFTKYFKNTLWLFIEKILRMGVGLFIGIWVARYLGPEQFGLFNYALSLVALFVTFSTLGLDTIVVRKLVEDESKREELIATAFWLRLTGAFSVLLILATATLFTTNDHYTNILVFIIASATIFQAFNVTTYYFQAKVLSRYLVYVNIVGLVLSSVAKVILILLHAPLIAFVLLVLIDSMILAFGFVYFYIKKNLTFNIKATLFKRKTAISLLKDSWPLILSGISISLYMRIDQVMIKEMLNTEAVGQYAAAVRISEAWYVIPMVIVSSLFPAIINAKQKSQELYNARLQKVYYLMVWMALAIAFPITFLSDWIINILYGIEYNEAASVLMIHIWTSVFVFLGVVTEHHLIAVNRTFKSFIRTFIGAILNIVFNLVFIPKYGINGAAIATLLSQLIANYIYDIFDKDLHNQLKMKTLAFIPIHIIKRT